MSLSITLSTRSIEGRVNVVNGFFADRWHAPGRLRQTIVLERYARGQERRVGKANGSRERAPDDRLRVPTTSRVRTNGGHGAMRLCPPYNGTVEEQRYACGLTSDVAAMARERK